MIFSPKLILISLLVILSLLIGLGNHNEDIFLPNGLAQKDGTESPAQLSPTCRLRGDLLSSQAVGVSSSAANLISDRHQ